jgi:hypothetical protein
MNEPLAAAYLSLSIAALRAEGPKPGTVGKRTLYDRQDLDRWVDDLFAAEVRWPTSRVRRGGALPEVVLTWSATA